MERERHREQLFAHPNSGSPGRYRRHHAQRAAGHALEYPAAPIAGDYNKDGVVNAADYVVWRTQLPTGWGLAADSDLNGRIDAADYAFWRLRFRPAGGQWFGCEHSCHSRTSRLPPTRRRNTGGVFVSWYEGGSTRAVCVRPRHSVS